MDQNPISGVFILTKYSKTLKIKVVQDYLTSPLGYKLIARKYGIKSNSLVVSWVQRYKAFGPKGLDVLSPEKTFDGSFKMNVLKWMNNGLKSIFETDFKGHSEPRLPSTAQINH